MDSSEPQAGCAGSNAQAGVSGFDGLVFQAAHRLGLTVSNPPTEADVQAIADKLDELDQHLERLSQKPPKTPLLALFGPSPPPEPETRRNPLPPGRAGMAEKLWLPPFDGPGLLSAILVQP